MKRAFLRSPGHFYPLEADVISIGRGINKELAPPVKLVNAGAHIPLKSGKAEPFHAVVEKQADNNSFLLTDLNTAYGTYVNEHRIQNESITLSPGDLIRFGHGGIPHEFGVSIPVQESQNAEGNLNQDELESGSSSESLEKSDIHLRPETAPSKSQMKHKKNLQKTLGEDRDRSRSVPMNMRITKGQFHNVLPDSNESSLTQRASYQPTESSFHPTIREGWSLDGHDLNDSCERDTMLSKASSWDKENSETTQPWYVAMLREKEQRLLHMGDEISRLSVIEGESNRKDGVISELREKIKDMEEKLQEMTQKASDAKQEQKLLGMEDEIKRMSVFERECERKDRLVSSLRDQIAKLEVDRQALIMDMSLTDANANTRQDNYTTDKTKGTEKLENDIANIDNSLLQTRDKLDEFRKYLNIPIPERRDPKEIIMELVLELEDKDDTINRLNEKIQDAEHETKISNGLVKALQREVGQSEGKLMKLNISIDKTKRELEECNAQYQAMSKRFANLKEDKKHDEIVAALEKEMMETREQLQATRLQLSQQQEKIDKQTKEIRRANRQNKQYLESGKLLTEKNDELTIETAEYKQKELASRVACEQVTSRLERLRSRIIQSVYTAPGATKPETRLSDAEVLGSIQKIINDRSEFHQQLSDLGQNVPPLLIPLEVAEDSESDASASSERKSAIARTSRKSIKK